MTRRPPRKRELTEEERRLWEAAMQNTRALDARRVTRPETKPEAARETTVPLKTETGQQPARRQQSMNQKPPSNSRQNKATAPATTPLARREARRIVRNPEAIDARIDLHGMRQREAYPALKGFLRAGQARGHRLVLVITGKGAGGAREWPSREDWDAWESAPFYESPRGVLRRLVPEWLAKPEFRDVVASVSPAHAKHGGDGALYVRLRRIAPQPQMKRSR